MLGIALSIMLLKHVVIYYVFNERFDTSLWTRQIAITMFLLSLFGVLVLIIPLKGYEVRTHDFSAAFLAFSSLLIEYIMLTWIKAVRFSVAAVMVSTIGHINRPLLRSRSFIAMFSLYSIAILSVFIFMTFNRSIFIYP